jgi:hypothetical protein
MTDRVFGAIGSGMLVLAAIFFLRALLQGGAEAGPARGVPELAILSPAPGAVLDQPAELEIDAGATLRPGRAGWATGDLHVHLFVGSTEVMPAATDLVPLAGTRYRWRLPRLPEGETTLRLTWSGPDHRSLEEGASAVVPVTLRGAPTPAAVD